MAPPRLYKSGIHDYHLSINTDYQEDFDDLCHKQRKSRNQYINELIIQELERNSIAENDMPGENISCLGYTPKPVQQKITDTQQQPSQQQQDDDPYLTRLSDEEFVHKLEQMNETRGVGKIQGYYSERTLKCKIRNNQINRLTLRA